MGGPNGTAAWRLWRRVNKDGPTQAHMETPCWLWLGYCDTKAYGHGQILGDHGKVIGTHRVAWEEANGAIPDGMRICHKCDVGGCVRPDHLFLGTDIDNMLDRDDKNRVQHGENHYLARLDAAKVREIRARHDAGERSSAIGVVFGVSTATVNDIVAGRTWRRVI